MYPSPAHCCPPALFSGSKKANEITKAEVIDFFWQQ
jgi:hypothetical protein